MRRTVLLALPVVAGTGPLEFREWSIGAPLQNGRFSIPEAVHGEFVTPSVVLVPLLAFDRRGFRLGGFLRGRCRWTDRGRRRHPWFWYFFLRGDDGANYEPRCPRGRPH